MAEHLLTPLINTGLLVQQTQTIQFGHDWLPAAMLLSEHTAQSYNTNKLLLGLTGNIAMGKSTVLDQLAQLGAHTINADSLVHKLREPGAAGYQPLIDLMGSEITQPDGRIDTQKLAEQAFGNPATLRQLEAIFRPLVVEQVMAIFKDSERQIVVVEAIKLLEGELKDKVAAVWVVDASRETQITRLMNTRGYSKSQAVNRIDAQHPQAEKLRQADVIIQNDGDIAVTRQQVLAAWSATLSQLNSSGPVAPDLARRFVSETLAKPGIESTALQALQLFARAMHSPNRHALPYAQAFAIANELHGS